MLLVSEDKGFGLPGEFSDLHPLNSVQLISVERYGDVFERVAIILHLHLLRSDLAFIVLGPLQELRR